MTVKHPKTTLFFIIGAALSLVVSACGLHLNCPTPTPVSLESGTYVSPASSTYSYEWTGAPELETEQLTLQLDRAQGTATITSDESEFSWTLQE